MVRAWIICPDGRTIRECDFDRTRVSTSDQEFHTDLLLLHKRAKLQGVRLADFCVACKLMTNAQILKLSSYVVRNGRKGRYLVWMADCDPQRYPALPGFSVRSDHRFCADQGLLVKYDWESGAPIDCPLREKVERWVSFFDKNDIDYAEENVYLLSDVDRNKWLVAESERMFYCGRCNKPGSRKKCARCCKVTYCDELCQIRHWSSHRVDCCSIHTTTNT